MNLSTSLVLFILGFFCIVTIPAFAVTMNAEQQKFIELMIPKIEKANQQIMQQRSKFISLYNQYQNQIPLNSQNQIWLHKLANQYGIKQANFNKNGTWEELSSRVDIVPVSLVLAQAINESAWGTSRFAKEGNSYFGQWCSAPGCGIYPKERKPGSPWQVRKFSNAYDSIVSYLNNLNQNHAYRTLRNIRYELRETGKPLDPNILAEGLKEYSAIGSQYIAIMQNIINRFQLAEMVRNYNQQLRGNA